MFPLLPTGPFTGTPPSNLRQMGGYFIAPDKTAFAVSVTWDEVQGAFTYVVEAGDTPGGNNLLVTEFAATGRVALVKLPFLGAAFVRVRAKAGASVGQQSAELTIPSADFRDFVEGLFFGTGAMAGTEPLTTCPAPTGGVMRGWPRGPTVQVLFGSGLGGGQLATVQRMVTQFAEASGVSVAVQNSPELAPAAATNRMVVATVPDDQVERACGNNPSLDFCFTNLSFAPFQVRLLIKASLTGHRLGVFNGWAYGLCGVGIPGWSVMSGFVDLPSEFTEADTRALRTIYGAGLGQGSPRSAFVAAGFIRP